MIADACALGFNAGKNENAGKPAREDGGASGCSFDSVLKGHECVYEMMRKAGHHCLTKKAADDRPQNAAANKLEKIWHNAAAFCCCRELELERALQRA